MPLPFLVIVSGVPGAGKATLADQLGQRLTVPVLGKDVIKSGIARTEGGPATYGGPIGERTFASLFECARVLLDAGCSLIVEAAFYRARFEVDAAPLLSIAQPRLICCTIDTALAAQRFEARARTGGPERFAHPDELIIDIMQSGRFDWDAFDLAPLDLPSLEVDTTGAYAPGVEEIAEFATR